MPIKYRINPALRLVEAEFRGSMSIDDLRDYAARIATDADFGPDLLMLADYSGVKPTAADMQHLQYGTWRSTLPPFNKIALVAPTDFEFGIARMYAATVGRQSARDVQVFRDRKSAFDWLGIPDPQSAVPTVH